MKHQSRLLSVAPQSGLAYKQTTKNFKPLSFYVMQGADLDGSMRSSVSPMYDDEDDLNDPDLLPDAMCDAHVGFDDMVEELGAIGARNLERAAKNGVASSADSSNS